MEEALRLDLCTGTTSGPGIDGELLEMISRESHLSNNRFLAVSPSEQITTVITVSNFMRSYPINLAVELD